VFKAWALHEAGCGTAQIIVNGGDVLEAHFAGSIYQTILQALALLVMGNLARRGLANVHDGAPTETIRR
jgi:hypothetical protein